MAPPPLSWLLRLAVLCHLTMLLAGQQRASNKCSRECDKMHSKIPLNRLIKYEESQPSCPKHAIIFETVKHAFFCADPKEGWVQEAIKHLNRKATTTPLPNGVVEKRIGGPRTTLAPRGMNSSAVSEPKTTWETKRPLGTSPELPTGVPGSWRPTSPTSPDGQPPAGPETTMLYNSAAVTTTTYQPERKAPEVTSAQAPSSQTLPPQTSSTETLHTQDPSSQTLPPQAPSSQTLPTQTSSTETLPTQAPSSQTLPTQTSSTETLPTQVPSTQALPHDAPSAHRNAFVGPSSIPHVSVVPTSFKGAPSSKPVTSSIWAPKHEDPQAPTRRQAVGLLAFLGLLFCLGVAMFAYQSLQACHFAGDMVEGLRYVPRSCGSNSYVLVPV